MATIPNLDEYCMRCGHKLSPDELKDNSVLCASCERVVDDEHCIVCDDKLPLHDLEHGVAVCPACAYQDLRLRYIKERQDREEGR